MTSTTQVQSSLDNYKGLMDERAELHMAKARIDARIKELDETLRPVLADRGEIVWNGYRHEVTMTAGRKTVDYKAMAEDYGIDLDAYTKVGKPSSRYTVKAVQEL